jgi:hypothetical protein
MRSVAIIVGGLVLLGVFVFAGRRLGGEAAGTVTAAKVFIGAWLLIALGNLWAGVARAGYSVAEELPIFLLIFAVPACAAAFVWWKLS